MHSSTYLSWFRRLLILGAIVAGLAASAAGARLDPGPPPDVRDVAASLSATPATIVARPPDVSDAAASASGLSSGIEPVYEHQLHSPATASQSVPVPGRLGLRLGRLGDRCRRRARGGSPPRHRPRDRPAAAPSRAAGLTFASDGQTERASGPARSE